MNANSAGFGQFSFRGIFGVIWVISLILSLLVMPTWDVAWRLEVAQRLLDNAVFYRDIIEVNPPLWFWGIVPSSYVATLLSLPPYAVMCVMVHVVALPALWLLNRCLMPLLSPQVRAWLILGALISLVLLPISDNGQREPPFFIAGLLWASLVVRRLERVPTPAWMSICIAVFAAYGFALKHYYLLIPIALEIWLIIKMKWDWRPLRLENLALAGCGLIYALAVVTFAPHFLSDIVPLVNLSYTSIKVNEEISPTNLALFLLGQGLVIIAPLYVVRRLIKTDPYLQAFVLCLCLHLLIVALQSKGFSNHLLAPKAAAISIWAYLAGKTSQIGEKIIIKPKIILAILVSLWIGSVTILALRAAHFPPSNSVQERSSAIPSAPTTLSSLDTMLSVIQNEPGSSRAFVLSKHPAAAFHSQFIQGRPIYTRYFSMWMISGLLASQQNPQAKMAATQQLDLVIANNISDIQCSAPHLLVDEAFKAVPVTSNFAASSPKSMLEILRTDAAFKTWFDDNYRQQAQRPEFNTGVAIWRANTASGPIATNCTTKNKIRSRG